MPIPFHDAVFKVNYFMKICEGHLLKEKCHSKQNLATPLFSGRIRLSWGEVIHLYTYLKIIFKHISIFSMCLYTLYFFLKSIFLISFTFEEPWLLDWRPRYLKKRKIASVTHITNSVPWTYNKLSEGWETISVIWSNLKAINFKSNWKMCVSDKK